MKVSIIIIHTHVRGNVALRRHRALNYFFVLECCSLHFSPHVTGRRLGLFVLHKGASYQWKPETNSFSLFTSVEITCSSFGFRDGFLP